ncbi:MAG: M24 family metallopeptidase [Phycisphaerales bacterium]|nr:M24 family metallopeptidase [Phycisphaerales bacterium]
MNINEIIVPPFPSEKIHESVVRLASVETYQKRIATALDLAAARYGVSHLVIYADREHFSNVHYFTGFDPRFEEAILILAKGQEPILMVGNEGLAYTTGLIHHPIQIVLYQSLSLSGQPRTNANKTSLNETFARAGISKASVVGTIGTKYYIADEVDNPTHFLDVPHFLVKALEAKNCKDILNVADLMTHPAHGIRTTLDIDEMAVLELAATKTSRAVYNLLTHVKPGMSEIEASAFFELDGDPMVAHPNVNFTLESVRQGVASPSNYKLKNGDPFNVGLGYRAAMVARTALYAQSPADIPAQWADIMEKIYKPYFRVVVLWYENLKIGTAGKSIIETIKRGVPEYDRLGVGLNPGHLIHTDEWTSSIFTESEAYPVRNGMSIQCDIIAVPKDYPGVHIEDGVIVADAETRQRFAAKYPENWKRIQARRKWMKEYLNIRINDEVLPLSDLQGCLSPWTANPHSVLAVAK